MFFVYTLIYLIALMFVLPFEYLKRPKGQRLKWLKDKWGKPTGSGVTGYANSSETILIHAVSVGEVLAAIPFITALKKRHPGLNIVVSTITDTGRKVACERLAGVVAGVIYLPFDIPFVIKSVIRRVRPKVFVTLETELWPNLFRTLGKAGIPVVILNGRISEKSFRGYGKIRFFLKGVLDNAALFCMQDEPYARRIIALGAEEARVRIIGSFKFDISLPAISASSASYLQWAEGIGGPVIVAGSTHRGEEALILDAFIRLREHFPSLALIIAPRHPERFDEVERIINDRGIDYRRRSRPTEEGKADKSAAVILLDSVGELSSVYALSDIAVVGGSFVEHGGQNPLEPAYWGKPVVCGPSMKNFPFIKDFYEKGAAIKAGNDNLYEVLFELLSSEEKRHHIGMRAKELLNRNRGAVQRALDALEPYL